MMKKFKQKYSFGQRKTVSQKMLDTYKDKIPIICEPYSYYSKTINVENFKKHKYIVPRSTTMGRFIFEIRSHLDLSPEQALFIFIKDSLPPTSALMGTLYDKYKDEDGFLYMTFCGENTFGE
jgi:GABA(A) receptor-associated protein